MNTPAPRSDPTWFGHPRGLTVLFLTETWEKFSYYGMRALLVYYMTKQLGFGTARASLVYGAYTALVYFTPILGGLLIDRKLGRRRAVVWGGSLMAAGHFLLSFETLFYPALGLIALGNGLFLPGLPSQIAGLYREGDPRQKTAYNIYYMGINLGSLMAPLVCGSLGELLGWHWGFAAAGLGMTLGLALYLSGSRWLPPESDRPAAAPARAAGERKPIERLGLLAGVWIAVVIFRCAYEQIGNTVALWADAGVDRSFAGRTIPSTWFQSLNPLLVLALAPWIASLWSRSRANALHQMAFGAGLVALSFASIALAAHWAGGDARASWLWLAGFMGLITVGELCVLPVGLGLFGRLAPGHLSASFIAAWFFASFGGNLLAGALGTLWHRLSPEVFFSLAGLVSAGAGLFLYGLARGVGKRDF